jgi:hypothetical protein
MAALGYGAIMGLSALPAEPFDAGDPAYAGVIERLLSLGLARPSSSFN